MSWKGFACIGSMSNIPSPFSLVKLGISDKESIVNGCFLIPGGRYCYLVSIPFGYFGSDNRFPGVGYFQGKVF